MNADLAGRPKGALGKPKKPKDPNKPKRSCSAYFFFIGEKRREAERAGHKITKVRGSVDSVNIESGL